jgi:hypothetical protein
MCYQLLAQSSALGDAAMTDADEDHDKRDRSPRFPYINLTVALERIQQIHAGAKGSAARLIDVAGDWGVSPTSSSTLRIAAALLAYGLIADEGSGESRKIRLTPEALRIISDTRPGVREHLLAEAALKSPVVAEYFQKWGRNRPSDGHAISSLKFDSGFTERAARTFLMVYDDLLTYVPETTKPQASEVAETPKQPTQLPQINTAEQVIAKDLPAQTTAPVQFTDSGKEWLRARVSKDVTARIIFDGEVTARMIERLIAVLQTQLEVLGDDA